MNNSSVVDEMATFEFNICTDRIKKVAHCLAEFQKENARKDLMRAQDISFVGDGTLPTDVVATQWSNSAMERSQPILGVVRHCGDQVVDANGKKTFDLQALVRNNMIILQKRCRSFCATFAWRVSMMFPVDIATRKGVSMMPCIQK